MYVITFYSFKGGVGRTMALVNVAAELVRRGRKVLVVDFDLEAPGLETYKRLQPKPNRRHPGVVEYVTEFGRTRQVPDLREFLYETKPIGKRGGRLWVMPAGRRDRAYRNALAKLDWQQLYRQDGFILFEDTKKGWEKELNPDYVLIDSRTGDTDVLGICTRQLPDSVVLMFTPNEQNLAGLENVCRDIRREATEGLKKTIRLHFVAANVPDLDDEKGVLHRQLAAFRDRLGIPESPKKIRKIQRYESLHLLDQSVFVLDRPYSRLARSYRHLVRALLKDNLADRDGALFFLQDYPKRHETRVAGEEGVFSSDEDEALPSLASEPPASTSTALGSKASVALRTLPVDSPDNKTRGHVMVCMSDGRYGSCIAFWRDIYSLHRICNFFKDDEEILKEVAGSFILEEDYRSAVQVFNRVLQLEPDDAHSLLHRALCKTNLADPSAAEDLLACLRWPTPQDDPLFKHPLFKSNCLTKLRAVAPLKLFDVADALETDGLPGVDPLVVASFLCETELGIPRAARLMRNYLAGLNEDESVSAGVWRILLRAHCWREVIQLHEAGRGDASSALWLALAQWGESGEMPEAICKQALEADEKHHQSWGLEAVALLLWRIGNKADAITVLDRAEQIARAQTDDSLSTEAVDEVFSLWRLCSVAIGRYLDDCQQLRRMFQGEPLRPAFLGPASPTTQV